MKRLFAILCGALLALAPLAASAGTMTLLGAGKAVGGGGGGYTGPGDVVSGAKAFTGLRAYTTAIAGDGVTKIAKVRNGTSSELCDVLSASNGGLGNVTGCTGGTSTGTAVTAFCSGATCYIDTLYDQTGNGNYAANGTTAQQPTLTFNCIGTLPCMTYSGGQVLNSVASSTSQPLTVSLVAMRSANYTVQHSVVGTATAVVFFSGAANKVGEYFGTSSVDIAANDNAWHALQYVANGASSVINVDTNGAGTTVSAGSNALGTFYIGAHNSTPNSPLTGGITEVALYASALNGTQQGNLCHNQYAYWGTSTAC